MLKRLRPSLRNGFDVSMIKVELLFQTLTVRRPSLSDLVAFDDLGQLDGSDLRAVFTQVERPQLLEALAGSSLGLRQRLLTKLPASASTLLVTELDSLEPVPFEAVQTAQQAVVEALCRLSREGHIAFDDPADMVA
jgi:flagellar motor switch protein FliG